LSALPQGTHDTRHFFDSIYIKLHQSGANPADGQKAPCIGLTKEDLNTNLTALVDSHGRAISLSLLSEQCSENNAIEPHPYRLRRRPLVGNKGFAADSLREHVHALGGGTCTLFTKTVMSAGPFRRRLIAATIASETSLAESTGIVVCTLATTDLRHFSYLYSTRRQPRLTQILILQKPPTTGTGLD